MVQLVHSCPVGHESQHLSISAEVLYHYWLRAQDVGPYTFLYVYMVDSVSVFRNGAGIYVVFCHPCRLYDLKAVRNIK